MFRAYKTEIKPTKQQTEGIGIDLGLKSLTVVSNGLEFKNINKTSRVRKLEKKLKREQKRLSKKYETNKKKGGNSATSYRGRNIDKQQLKVQKLHQKLTNIRHDYINKVIYTLVKTNPMYITIEDLNVRGMMKNKHLAKSIAQQNFYYFKERFEQKCTEYDTELRTVSRFYPSSKTCSVCGSYKKDLKLNDRVYKCEYCGAIKDRDLNAAINLAKCNEYTIA